MFNLIFTGPGSVSHSCFLGLVVFVDVRSSYSNHSESVSAELQKLGATVVPKLTSSVTHIVFKDGSTATISKSAKLRAHLVNVQWVER